jgi:hypothetical protein
MYIGKCVEKGGRYFERKFFAARLGEIDAEIWFFDG